MADPAPPLLAVDNVTKRFRGLTAVNAVSLSVAAGDIVAVIGPNGAGKTTLFNVIAGVFAPNEGDVRFAGASIAGLPPERVCAAGIARTFQIVRPFKELTVEDNVMVGALRTDPDVARGRIAARAVLEQIELDTKRGQRAGALTLPDRKRLEVARALATRPRLLLLDEVMAGLRPTETDRMVAILAQINRDTGLTILLIEHVMRAVMALSRHIAVLHHGEKIADGRPADVVRDPRVLESYLGEEAL